ncbi:MAG: long-chain fatty acid--CoA ligase [Myxococcota bacterium]
MLPPPVPLTRLFLERAERSAERVASRAKVDGQWVPMTWRGIRLAVEEICLGLLELGVARGDRVAILSQTRREWGQADMAILCLGGVTVGIYPTLTAHQTKALLLHSGARVVFAEDAAAEQKLKETGIEDLRIIAIHGGPEGPGRIGLDALRRRGRARADRQPEELERRVAEAKTSDVVTFVYTSGTTGDMKGAMLTHANFHYVIHATSALIPYEGERTLGFLPLAHSLQRYVSYLGLIADADLYYAESLEKVQDNLQEVHPTALTLVPRVLEKIHAKIMEKGQGGSALKRRIFSRSLGALATRGNQRRAGRALGLGERVAGGVADRLVGARIKERLGGAVKFIGCGSAPLARDVHLLFEDIGIPILEGWGLTETAAPVTLNTLDQREIGSVGRPLPGTDVRVAEDGELLVRGPGVFSGYYNDPEATEAAFDAEGWFKTGDIGTLERSGFIRITDRKKNLIITAGGKNIAPQPIESALTRDPLIAEAVLIGDRRPYLVALLALEPAEVTALARAHQTPDDPASVAAIPAVKARLDRAMEGVNTELARFEQLKRWEVLPEAPTIESGLLTPTLKVKRRALEEHYRTLVDRLYEGGA